MNAVAQKVFVCTLLRCTSRKRSFQRTEEILNEYMEMAGNMPEEHGRRRYKVPVMTGVDEDMREWSFYMLLEHNAIVNRAMARTLRRLALNQKEPPGPRFDPKKDVMPGVNPGSEQLENFRLSVHEHLDSVGQFAQLRRTATYPHPLFGDFDAHMWNGMFWLHLKIHLPQARILFQSFPPSDPA